MPFDLASGYPNHVDGKSRLDGVQAFPASRDIVLPMDAPPNEPDAPSVQSLGAGKNHFFLEHLARHGIEPYGAAINLVQAVRAGDDDPATELFGKPVTIATADEAEAAVADSAHVKALRAADANVVSWLTVCV